MVTVDVVECVKAVAALGASAAGGGGCTMFRKVMPLLGPSEQDEDEEAEEGE